MKKIKKLFAVLLAVTLILVIMPMTVFAATTVDDGSCGDELSWKLDSDGVLTISGEGVMDNYVEDFPSWFDHVEKIKSIVIEDGVTSIGDFAFFLHSNVIKVTIPASVKSIGAYAFQYCESLMSVRIPEGVRTIGEGAFSICTFLESVSIPKSVTKIEPLAFAECYSLDYINVDVRNESYTGSGGVLFDKNMTTILCTVATLEGEYSIPDTVVEIPAYAFTNSLFLEKLTIPANVVYIEACAFMGCISLTEVIVNEANTEYCADERGVLFDKEMKTLYCAPGGITGSYTIPKGVEVIEPYAFALCMNLNEIIISNTVKEIWDEAFTLSAIKKVTIPASVENIEFGAFAGCTELTEIRFEGDAPEIGSFAFEEVTATAYYPDNNSTWDTFVREDFGGKIEWKTYTPETRVPGDVDGSGDITNTDLIIMARYIVGLENSADIEKYGDIDGDGKVTNTDLVAAARIVVGIVG